VKCQQEFCCIILFWQYIRSIYLSCLLHIHTYSVVGKSLYIYTMSLNVTMQHFRRLNISSQMNPHRFLRRMSNLQFPGGSFGYECSQHSSGDLEKGSLERSLGRGCKTLVTRTTDHTPEVYDFLFDLSDNEECDLQNMQIGHIYSTNRNISATTATACLKDVNAVLKQAKRGLDFVTVTVPSDEEVSLSALRNSLIEIRDSATVPTGKPVVRTGLDISASLLTMQNQPGALEKLTKEVLGPLCEEKLCQTLTIATNAFTFPQSHHLYRWVKNWNSESGNSSRKIRTIATEVLRAHPRTPALLTAGYPHTVPHRPSGRPATSPGQEEEAGDGAVDKRSVGVREATHNIKKAVADLELALDRCIQTEKIFLSKAGESVREKVPITDVCLGHVLYKTLAQFQSPEEWQSILSNQVEEHTLFFFSFCCIFLYFVTFLCGYWKVYKLKVKNLFDGIYSFLVCVCVDYWCAFIIYRLHLSWSEGLMCCRITTILLKSEIG